MVDTYEVVVDPSAVKHLSFVSVSEHGNELPVRKTSNGYVHRPSNAVPQVLCTVQHFPETDTHYKVIRDYPKVHTFDLIS